MLFEPPVFKGFLSKISEEAPLISSESGSVYRHTRTVPYGNYEVDAMATEAEKVEGKQQEAESTKSSESAVTEANAGKVDLVDKQKEQIEYLKSGGRSGITDDFGKPLLFDGDFAQATRKAVTELTKVFKGEESEEHSGTAKAEKARPVENAESTESKGRKPAPAGEVHMEPLEVIGKPPYAGEGLKMDVPADFTIGKAGDTLESLAKGYLPKDATAEQIKAYEKELAIVNGLDPANPGDLAGKKLSMPGHTADGGIVTLDSNYRQTTRWQDGREKIEDPNGRGYERTPDGSGGYKEKHWGPRPGDQFELTTGNDGQQRIADKAGDKPREVPPASKEVADERQKLKDLAEEKIADPEKRAKFEADMLRFEERAAKQVPPLSPEEITKTYKEMERLLSATGDAPLKQDDRVKIAEQVMSQVANPRSIDQGQHETCNMTTAEILLYTKNPSDAVKLVTDVATTGEYTAKDGTKVTIDPRAADGEAKMNPPGDGDRSHASQIFQVTAVNLYYQKQPYTYTDAAGNSRTVPAGQLEYQQVPSQPGAVPPVVGGERLFDKTTTPPTVVMKNWTKGIPEDSPDLADRAMVDVPNMITGNSDATMIEHNTAVYGDATGVKTFKTEEEMKDFIKKAKEEHKLPIIMGVHSGQEPFLHDSGNGAAGGSGGWHVVTITDYDEATGKVKIDNQWGSEADHQGDNGVHVHDLYRASRSPEATEEVDAPWYKPWAGKEDENVTIRDLEKDVEWDRDKDTIDTQKEFELLRLKHQYGGMSDADYDDELKDAIDDAADRWQEQKDGGTFDQNEYNNAQSKLRDMVKALPPERRIDFLEQMHEKGMIDDASYKSDLIRATGGFFGEARSSEQTEEFMNKVKAMTDGMSAEDKNDFYQTIHDNAKPSTRLEMIQMEMKTGAIDDAKYDELIVSTTKDYLSASHTAAESASYAARLWTIVSALPESRRESILKKITPSPAPAPAGP